jgi:parvulin-like peptidyl-prolyl isomerase
MLQYDYSLRAPVEVQQQFGSYFAEEIFKLEPGWQGPVASGYGVHLVYIGDRVEGRIPELAEVRDRVVNDFNRERSQRANQMLYEGLRTNYDVVIDDEAVARALTGAAASP